MYKYSRHAEEDFIAIPVLAFLFAWFCKTQKQFMLQRTEESNDKSFGKKIVTEADNMF